MPHVQGEGGSEAAWRSIWRQDHPQRLGGRGMCTSCSGNKQVSPMFTVKSTDWSSRMKDSYQVNMGNSWWVYCAVIVHYHCMLIWSASDEYIVLLLYTITVCWYYNIETEPFMILLNYDIKSFIYLMICKQYFYFNVNQRTMNCAVIRSWCTKPPSLNSTMVISDYCFKK